MTKSFFFAASFVSISAMLHYTSSEKFSSIPPYILTTIVAEYAFIQWKKNVPLAAANRQS
jgi:hypothetical protein